MNLFRPEVLESRQQSTLGRVVLFAPRYAGFLVFLIVCATAALVLFVVFGSYTRKATVMGEIVPVSGVIKVYPPQAGRIEAVLVKSGDRVIKGDALVRINSAVSTEGGNREQQVLAALQAQDEALARQLQRNGDFHEAFLRQMADRRAAVAREEEILALQEKPLAAQRDLAAKNEARYRDLMKKDYVSKEAHEQRAAERLALDGQWQQLQRQRHEVARQLLLLAQEEAQQKDAFAREANDLARQQAQVRAQMTEVAAQQSVVVQAPQDGMISSVLLAAGQQAAGNVPLVVMVPQDAAYEAALYAPSEQMGLWRRGSGYFCVMARIPTRSSGSTARW
ncbi:MAG: biotin/lipoyl-binding protein [Cardiobacteriaceae bacterium]|nr:biotin/lipoyl-binding protein [Cardiobacteriaceae bacterium]